MGYGSNGGVQTFAPDDTENVMYLNCEFVEVPLTDLLEKIKEKWPNVSLGDISISAEHIHTDCIGYDSYDPCDWSEFLIIRKIERPAPSSLT